MLHLHLQCSVIYALMHQFKKVYMIQHKHVLFTILRLNLCNITVEDNAFYICS